MTDSATQARRKKAKDDDADVSRPELGEIVTELDKAVVETSEWLSRFHRSALCKVKPDPDLIAPDPAGHTEFGTWYAEREGTGIFDQPAFADLAVAHQSLLSHASIIARRAWRDDRVPVEEYDSLHEKHRDFNDKARRMARAFRAALSDLDPLTGTHTRQGMERDLAREQQRANRSHQPVCLALADIDHFKKVNDTYGHQTGDRVLTAVTRILMDSLRPYDSIYRYGGEEFLLCLPETSEADARATLDRVRHHIEAAIMQAEDGSEFSVTCSFGIAKLEPRQPLRSIIEHADQALYKAKDSGRNQVCAWSAGDM